jgi:hypothetical protein
MDAAPVPVAVQRRPESGKRERQGESASIDSPRGGAQSAFLRKSSLFRHLYRGRIHPLSWEVLLMMTRICGRTITLVAALLAASPALAETSRAALKGAESCIGPAAPEPGAALLFGAGAALVAWAVRGRRRR